MTEAFATAYIPRRMQQLGYGDRYFLAFRHLVLAPDETRSIDAGNDLYIQLTPLANLQLDNLEIQVESEFGFFSQATDAANELTYEHRGRIEVTNLNGTDPGHIQFIQVIPQNQS